LPSNRNFVRLKTIRRSTAGSCSLACQAKLSRLLVPDYRYHPSRSTEIGLSWNCKGVGFSDMKSRLAVRFGSHNRLIKAYWPV